MPRRGVGLGATKPPGRTKGRVLGRTGRKGTGSRLEVLSGGGPCGAGRLGRPADRRLGTQPAANRPARGSLFTPPEAENPSSLMVTSTQIRPVVVVIVAAQRPRQDAPRFPRCGRPGLTVEGGATGGRHRRHRVPAQRVAVTAGLNER